MKFLLKLLSGDAITPSEMYTGLNQSDEKFKNVLKTKPNESLGLGKVFKQKTRQKYATASSINDIFTIDEAANPPTAIINNTPNGLNALLALAHAFRDGKPQEGIKKNQDKYGLCLALLVHAKGNAADDTLFTDLEALYTATPSVFPAVIARKDAVNAAKKAAQQAQQAEAARLAQQTRLATEVQQLRTIMTSATTAQQQQLTAMATQLLPANVVPKADLDTTEQQLNALKAAQQTQTNSVAHKTIVHTMLKQMGALVIPGDLQAKKQGQEAFFKTEIKKLSADSLVHLIHEMNKVPTAAENDPMFLNFKDVRTERHFFRSDYGNTATWQRMVSAAKQQLLLTMMAKPTGTTQDLEVEKSEADKKTLHDDDFAMLNTLVSEHHGRTGTAWGSTRSSNYLAGQFKLFQQPTPGTTGGVPIAAPLPTLKRI